MSPQPTLDALRARLRGSLVAPGDDEYDAARAPWNLAIDQTPVAVVAPADVDDLTAVIAAAADAGWGVTAQPNGHGASGDLADTILVRPHAFDGIAIDTAARVARVGAGVNWGPVLAQLDGTGLIALAGSNPAINVVGYSINGGHSMFGRRFGLAAHSITAVELVDGTGRFRRVTPETDAELLWALRGGGGLFGIVTAIEFALHPADTLVGGTIVFPFEAARDVIATAFEIAADDPALGIDVGLAHFPHLPIVPEPLRGRRVASIAFVHVGDEASAAPVIARLRAIATPIVDGITVFSIGTLAAVAAEPVDPLPTIDWGDAVDGFDRDSAGELVAAFEAGAEHGLSRVGFRVLGGRIGDPVDPDGGVIGAISAPALGGAGVLAFDPAVAAGAQEALQPLRDLAAARPAPGMVPTFMAAGSTLADAYGPEAIARLAAVKERVDPHGVIRSNRPLA